MSEKCETNGDFRLYEMEYPKASRSIRHIDSASTKQDGMGYHSPPKLRRSEKLSYFDPREQDHEQSQPRRSIREKVPHHRFEIERNAFMISHYEEKPKTI